MQTVLVDTFLISFSTDFSVDDSDDFNPPITKRLRQEGKQSVYVLSESDEEVRVVKIQY